MANSSRSNQITDSLNDTVANAIATMARAMEPKLNEFATEATHRALDGGRKFAENAYHRVRAQPWYLVGVAAFLLVGAAILLGFNPSEDSSESGENRAQLH